MLQWIARHIDQADRAEIWLSDDEYPETWLTDLQVKLEATVRPAMNRVLDIEKMGGMRWAKVSFLDTIYQLVPVGTRAAGRFELEDGSSRCIENREGGLRVVHPGIISFG